MNIKITKEQHERLLKHNHEKHIFGSRLFGTEKETSDYDYMMVYHYQEVFYGMETYLPNIHSFQYDDVENNSQYIWVTEQQFYQNLFSGDGTIQSDIFLFTEGISPYETAKVCRTFKVIKAYCGVAKRDLKLHNSKNKLFHANRSLYIAEKLLNNETPTKKDIQKLSKN